MRDSQGNESNLGSLGQVVYTVALLDQMDSKLARVEELKQARNAILFCHQAGVSSGTWSLNENGYEALRTIVKLFEQQLATSPLAHFEKAKERLAVRVRLTTVYKGRSIAVSHSAEPEVATIASHRLAWQAE